MVPARLTIRNFLCYAEDSPSLELEGIRLACLSGENGHGKSALLDAITWALWGKARGKSIDSLIHLGRKEMQVDFEFLVGDVRYRVVRKRERVGGKGGGRSELHFYARTADDWKAFTGASVSETERAIESTLRLSYETFVNSAMLLQGKADLFTASGPADRKRVLAEILGLGRYDTLEARAREIRRDRAQQAAIHANALADIEPHLARLPEFESEREARSAELDETVALRSQRDAELSGVRAAHHALEQQRRDLHDAEGDHVREAAAVQTAEARLTDLRALIEGDERIAATRQAVEDGYHRLLDARAAERRWLDAARRRQELEEQLAPLRRDLARAEERLRADLRAAQENERKARTEADHLPALVAALAAAEAEASALSERRAQAEGLAQQVETLRRDAALLRADNVRLRDLRKEKHTRFTALREAEQRGEVHCPLCRTRLGVDGLRGIEETYKQEADADLLIVRDNEGRIAALEEQAARHEQSAATLGREEAAARSRLDRDIGALRTQHERARQAEGDLTNHHAIAESLAARLAGDGFAEDKRRRVEELEQQRDAVPYDPAAHRTAEARTAELAHYEQKERTLREVLVRLEAARADHDARTIALTEARDRLAAVEARVLRLTAAVQAQPDLSERLIALEAEVRVLQAQQSDLEGTLGGLDRDIAHCRELARQHEQHAAALATAREEEAIYDELARAFGKNGVQALIIDTVLPEVEREANHLLSGMSNGRMALTLETQRALRTGDLAESLEIRIGDEVGTRDYEMYSGGEAFRINLALRIALSKLLARRSGAPLPTLIIDEGFGSQDAAGQERMIEAVTAIQQQFECLLVVTHIEELKQMFDTRIEVVKGPRGSTAQIVTV